MLILCRLWEPYKYAYLTFWVAPYCARRLRHAGGGSADASVNDNPVLLRYDYC